jgi:cation diffusion facilitator family transporter
MHDNRRVQQPTLARFAWLSIGAAIVTIGLKAAAYLFTGSVGLLSDALESLVNLVSAILALIALHVAARPPDEEHAYGHSKAEYFSSGVEGGLITIAAISIAATAIPRLFNPQPIESGLVGLSVSTVAALINLGVALVLRRAGQRYNSIALVADSQHLLTDVITSVGVIIGVGLVLVTGWLWLDPVIALLMAANIVWMGVKLVRTSALGLLDTALPEDEVTKLREVLRSYQSQGVQHHALRTRQAGARSFVSVHILVPAKWTVRQGHQLLERVEADIRAAIPNTTVFTHLEPLGDKASYEDQTLERADDSAATARLNAQAQRQGSAGSASSAQFTHQRP